MTAFVEHSVIDDGPTLDVLQLTIVPAHEQISFRRMKSGVFVVVASSSSGAFVVGVAVTVISHCGALYVGLKHSFDEVDILLPLHVVNFFTHAFMTGALVPKYESTIDPKPITISN